MLDNINLEKINSTRQFELDVAKSIAIILMIISHIGMMYAPEDSIASYVCECLGSELAAPTFILCMGVGFIYTSKQDAIHFLKRGLKLLIVGYILNLSRDSIPYLLGHIIKGTEYDISTAIGYAYLVDILQFAGVSMILYSLFKKLNLKSIYILFISILMLCLGNILFLKGTGITIIDAILDLFITADRNSAFPLLNWFIFVAVGICFGQYLIHTNKKEDFYKYILPLSIVGVIISHYLILTDENYYDAGSYYCMSLKNVFYALCYVMFLISSSYFIFRKVNINKLKFFTFSSTNITTIYIISWLSITWIYEISYLIGLTKSNTVFFFALLILPLSYLLTFLYKKIINKIKNKKQKELK